MPMDFPDMESLVAAAKVHKFRVPHEGEEEGAYRSALANHVQPIDRVESEEIRNKVGWDKFDDSQNKMMLFRSMLDNMPSAGPRRRPQVLRRY